MFRRVSSASRVVQEPGPPLRLIHPYLDQTRSAEVAVLLADIMDLAQPGRERLIGLAKFGKHVAGFDEPIELSRAGRMA